MSNESFFTGNLPKEKTEEYPSLQEGNYLTCLGKVEMRTRKDGVTQLHLDHILIQRTGLENNLLEKPYEYTTYTPGSLKLRKRPDGSVMAQGIVYSLAFLLDFSTVTLKLKGFQTYRKRHFAKVYDCLNEETGEIDWTAISKKAGQVVSFQIKKNTYVAKDGMKKTNMDMDIETYSPIPGQVIPLDDIVEIYKQIALSRAEENSKTATPVQVPTTPDDDLPF